MGRMSISDVKALRSASHSSFAAALSYKQYDAYKSARSLAKPASKISQCHLSKESRQFSGASLKKMATPNPGSVIIPLGTGRPNAEFFPWESLVIQNEKFADPQPWSINGGAAHKVPKRDGIYDLTSVLDYGYAAGAPQLLRFITEHVELVHDPPYSDWGTCLSAGSTSALEIALRIFCNRGDTILAEQLTYPGFLEAAELLGVAVRGIEMDAEGIKPESLSKTLRNWNEADGRKPSMLYTIPSGHNPTGTSQTYERKLEVYSIAEEHDLIIIEDDPYYFLQLNFCKTSGGNGQDFLKSLIPSYVSIDTSGRVVRLDSTSKILAPGLRAGWVTANDCIIDKFLSYHEVSTAFVNGPSQLMLYKLLEESWGHLGFLNWLADLSARYRQRREIMVQACQTHLPRTLCTWSVPPHGLFLWIHVNITKHHEFGSSRAVENGGLHRSIEERIMASAYEKGVQVTNGSMFQVSHHLDNEIGFRFTFATADESELDTGVRFFAEAVKDVFSVTH
uniref:Putative aminotransferase n=1 Tax=Chaetothyriaceae sp. TaxID=1963369 RepID=A0A2Z2EZI9_9EURO|nr:putative aminotransferase [Chaetothyriaceae sp.]